MRSAENVLEEIDMLCKNGVKEITFLDDHFFFDRQRAIDIMKGIMKYNILWKCVNLTVWLLDEELLDLMKKSGCYMMVISVESGDQYVVNKIVKKPIKLDKTIEIVNMAKSKGFDILANFIIGFPHETWEQVRTTIAFASEFNVDMVNFHIATPLPNTELMDICIREGIISDFDPTTNIGYTSGVIETDEFTPKELEILRAFEWDRINFSTANRREAIARIQNITLEELEQWRINTRRSFGINVGGI
jgi:anaerobic magnesium-protoporphyrin IX monomethyl ester cyclase